MKSLLAALRLRRLRFHWDAFARRDPLWAVLTAPDKKGGRWTLEEFFARGELEIAAIEALLRSRGIELGGKRALDFSAAASAAWPARWPLASTRSWASTSRRGCWSSREATTVMASAVASC